MPNPTGSTYLSALANYTWQDGDVYQIPQTDTVGRGSRRRFVNGLGVANQPHQEILNKLQLIVRQVQRIYGGKSVLARYSRDLI
jgi:hypothetical protein